MLSYAWHVLGIKKPTLLSMPGGAKNIVARTRTARAALSLANSVYVPENGNLAMFQHRGCGAYEVELAKIFGDGNREKKHHENELRNAGSFINNEFGLSTTSIYAESDMMNYIDFQPITL